MLVKREISEFYELGHMCWGGAVDTLEEIREKGFENRLMDFLESYYNGYYEPTETDVNDLLWLERDYIYECIGLNTEEEDEDE